MAGARRSSAGKRGRMPGWAILLLGLTLGIAGVLVMQLVIGRSGSTDGLAALFKPSAKPTSAETTKRPEPTPAKPKLDFYTVLPEVETVLPERTSKTKSARTERP